MEVLWDGKSPKVGCPYSVDSTCNPAPARRLDSLESGRLMLTVDLKGAPDAGKVCEVIARLVNKAKEKRSNDRVEVSSSLTRKDPEERWSGELGIPVTWMEGGINTYSRSGMWEPESKGPLFAFEITYILGSGGSCKARFSSGDAFHWDSGRKQEIV